MQDYPEVNVHVEYRRANQVYEGVLGNIVDLGLVAYPVPRRETGDYPLAQGPAGARLPSAASLREAQAVKLKALNGQKFISFEPDMPTRKALDKIFKGQGVTVQHVMEFDNIETVKRAVELDCGVAIVPQATVKQEVTQKTLAAVPLEGNHFRHSGRGSPQ